MKNTISLFYPAMKTIFITNYNKILEFIELHSDTSEICNVNIYTMTTNINYKLLKDKFLKTKTTILLHDGIEV